MKGSVFCLAHSTTMANDKETKNQLVECVISSVSSFPGLSELRN